MLPLEEVDLNAKPEVVGSTQIKDFTTPPKDWIDAFAKSYNELSGATNGEQEGKEIWADGDQQWCAARMMNGAFLGERDGREEADDFWHIDAFKIDQQPPTHYQTGEYLM